MTLHVYSDVEQRSEQWYELRRGIVTASVVGQLVSICSPDALTLACPICLADPDDPCVSLGRKVPTPIKTAHDARAVSASGLAPEYRVADNDTSRRLIDTLVAERIAGWTEDTPTTSDMYRGLLCEPIARDAYAEHYAPVTQVGFMRREEDGWTLGLSPDGLVGDDGLIEIKAPRAKAHIRTIIADEVPSQYVPQCQAALLASGREWLDFVSFCGGLPLFTKRVLPDVRWFAAIGEACRNFETVAREMVAEYRTRAIGLPQTERVDTDLELVI